MTEFRLFRCAITATWEENLDTELGNVDAVVLLSNILSAFSLGARNVLSVISRYTNAVNFFFLPTDEHESSVHFPDALFVLADRYHCLLSWGLTCTYVAHVNILTLIGGCDGQLLVSSIWRSVSCTFDWTLSRVAAVISGPLCFVLMMSGLKPQIKLTALLFIATDPWEIHETGGSLLPASSPYQGCLTCLHQPDLEKNKIKHILSLLLYGCRKQFCLFDLQ